MKDERVKILSNRGFTYFLQLAETLNYTKTAQLLGISQPALTQQIKKLESKVQSKLFYTTGKHLHLTKAGEVLRTGIIEVYDVLTDVVKRIHDENSNTQGKITIGMSASIEDKVLTDFITNYFKEYPEIEISLFTVSRQNVWELLDKDELDIAVLYLPVEEINKRKDFAIRQIFQDELLFLHHQPELQDLKVISYAEASKYPWVSYPQNYFVAQVIQEAFEKANFTKPQSIARFTKPEQMFRFSNETGTPTALPKSFFNVHQQEGALSALRFEPPIMMDLAFVFRKDKLAVPRIKHFFDVFDNYVSTENYVSRLKNIQA